MFNKILIVDDSSTSRMIIKKCFSISGYDDIFIEAEDGLQGLEMLQKNPDIDLVISDINMPNLNGNEFIKKIRKIPKNKNLKIIVISSLASVELEEDLIKLEVDIIIRKPITPTKLIQSLDFFKDN